MVSDYRIDTTANHLQLAMIAAIVLMRGSLCGRSGISTTHDRAVWPQTKQNKYHTRQRNINASSDWIPLPIGLISTAITRKRSINTNNKMAKGRGNGRGNRKRGKAAEQQALAALQGYAAGGEHHGNDAAGAGCWITPPPQVRGGVSISSRDPIRG